jgi:hypothetical protein
MAGLLLFFEDEIDRGYVVGFAPSSGATVTAESGADL